MNVAASRPPVSRHLLANALGRGWTFLSIFIFVPMYVHLLGVDGFGIIALFTAVSGIVALLDLGFSPTLARELNHQRRSVQEKADLLYTYEIAYAAFIGLLVLCAVLVPVDAFSLLLSSQDMARPDIADSVRLIFVAAAAQLYFFFYVAGLLGTEEQVTGNVVIVAAGIVRSAAVVLPLWLYPTPMVYLLWQIVFAVVFAGVARFLLYSAVRREAVVSKPTFRLRLVTQNLGFTGGMFLVSLTAAVNTQLDKLLVGRLIGIGALAEYSVVSTFAQLLVFIVSPITIAMLPRFVRSVTCNDVQELQELFSVAYKLVGAVVAAAVGSMIVFGPFLINLWTVNKFSVDSIAAYSTPLVVGYALLALSTVPHCAAVANKKLKGSMAMSATLVLTIPSYWFLVWRFGSLGAAFTWLALQAVVVPLYTRWVNKHCVGIRNVGRSLLAPAVLLPLLVSLGVNFLASRLVDGSHAPAVNVAVIFGTAAVVVCACVLVALRRTDIDYLLGHVRAQQS